MLYPLYREALAGKPLPLAFVDLDRFRANALHAVARAQGKPLRLASKSVRVPALLQQALESHQAYQGVMAYSAREALVLFEHLGVTDLLVGYPQLDAAELDAACTLAERGATIRLMADLPTHLERAQAAAQRRGVTLGVVLDVDGSLRLPGLYVGVRRSALCTPQAAVALANRVADARNLRLDGVMLYEAQVAGLPDAVPGQWLRNRLIRYLKGRSITLAAQRRAAVVEALQAAGHTPSLVNAGGTGSLETSAAEAVVTEVTMGSGLLTPTLFDNYQGWRHLPAAGFALGITRMPEAGIYTAHGGGYVASGAAGADKLPTPWLPEGMKLLPAEGAGEVQTPFTYRGTTALRLGDPVFFRHAKAGELFERFPTVYLIQQGSVVEQVPTYRGLGHHFV